MLLAGDELTAAKLIAAKKAMEPIGSDDIPF
jgi:hypothetical protein